jgi:pSer/pThr/pTyr-binding forkhead associated (FHA) protein
MADTVCADDDPQVLGIPYSLPPPAGQKICSQCGTSITPGFKFCGNCGSPAIIDAPVAPSLDSTIPAPAPFMEPAHAPAPAPAPAPVARLIVQRPDGSTAPVIDLFEGETILGRATHPAFSNDYYMSPNHCKLIIDAGSIFVEDLGSLNGTFFRLSHEELLQDGDIFRVGTEVLRYQSLPPVDSLEDGTIIAGSPNLDAWGRLELIMGKGVAGQAFAMTGERIRIGREEGDITFPDDGYVSGEHLEITRMDNASYLIDLNSSNGTYLNIKRAMELDPAIPILMGYQLYRIELL